MGFFDKKTCDICGAKIKLLGNRKLDDGNLCKSCAKNLSPWFEERRHSTVENIKQQLAYREENREKVQEFVMTVDIPTDNGYHVYLDNRHGWFAIDRAMDRETNPDIIDLSCVVNCMLDVDENRHEDKYRDSEGDWVSYSPPRYSYSYDYWMRISVNYPWFDDMDFKINSFEVDGTERQKMMHMENIARQITMSLTGGNNGMGANMGFSANQGMPVHGGMNQNQYGGINQQGYPNQAGINQQGYPNQAGINQQGYPNQAGINQQGYPNQAGINQQGYPNQAGINQQGYPNQGMNYNQAQNMNYQQTNTMANGQASGNIQCDKCGWMAPDPNTRPKFCPMCGDAIDINDFS